MDYMSELDRNVIETMSEDGIAAVIRGKKVSDPKAFVTELALSGIRCVEFTFTIPDVLEIIREASSVPLSIIGAGTVITAGEAEKAIAAGASFIVSPGLAHEIVYPCKEAGIPLILGAFTPTEVMQALALGCSAVKIFPAGILGARFIKDLLGPFPTVKFMPSGGISPANTQAFLEAGATAVFAGSDLASRAAVEEGDLTEIRGNALSYKEVISKARPGGNKVAW